jgi:hypothetical protein
MLELPRKDYVCCAVFSIVYWLIVAGFVLLFAFSFGAVPIGSMGLYYNYFYDRYGSL